MRKILLATTALVGVALGTAAPAHAAAPPMQSPITVNVGGYVDAVAGVDHEAQSALNAAGSVSGFGFDTNAKTNSTSFETEFKLNIDALGKAANGIQYGANISLWNGPEIANLWTGGMNTVELNSAYVWLSGAFGKALFGDEHGASDLFVYAPTVGEGQFDGRYLDFVSPFLLARMYGSGIDNTEHSTKITYYTPKVGNDSNKVQAGISFAPQMYDYGSDVTKTNISFGSGSENYNFQNGPFSPYEDLIKAAVQYTGNFHPVNVVASAQILNGSAQSTVGGNPLAAAFAPTTGQFFSGNGSTTFQDFTAWGIGTQVAWNGFTVGGSYNDMGRYNTVHGQDKAQQDFTLGGKYEIDKVAVAVNWLNGQGYDNLLAVPLASTTNKTNYVGNFNAYGAGATYTWFPGLTSAVDGVFFTQDVDSVVGGHNDGYVFLVSQKLTF